MGKTELHRGIAFEYYIRDWLRKRYGWTAVRQLLSGHLRFRIYTGTDDGDVLANYKDGKDLYIEAKKTKNLYMTVKRKWLIDCHKRNYIAVLGFGKIPGHELELVAVDHLFAFPGTLPQDSSIGGTKQIRIYRGLSPSGRLIVKFAEHDGHYLVIPLAEWVKKYEKKHNDK